MKPSLKARGTLRDVAKALGVSHTTVSNAFNRPDQLSPELREKIMATARAMKYSGPNPAARMLNIGYARTIAVVWAESLRGAFEDQAASAFLGGVAEACAERGVGMLLFQALGTSPSIIQAATVDGFIIYSIPRNNEILKLMAERRLPMVSVDHKLHPRVPCLGIDNRAAAQVCAQHLKDLGHERVGIVSLELKFDGYRGFIDADRIKSSPVTLADRVKGYLDIFGKGRSRFPLKIWESPSSHEEEGRIAAENFFQEDVRPTAILAASDRLAIGVIEAARRHGIQVPRDLSVIGFDDIPAAQLVTPQLTTVNQPFTEKGRLAVSALLDEKAPLRRELPTTLIIRHSTDRPNAG